MAQAGVPYFRSKAPIAVAGLILALLAGAVFAASAQAGAYEARFCAEGVTEQGDNGSFQRFGNETVFGLTNACGNANGLRISHNAGEEGTEGVFGRWLAERPEAITVGEIAYKARGTRSAGYFPQVIGTSPGGGLDVINGDQELDGAFKDLSVSGDVRRFGVQLVCQTGGGACAEDPTGQPQAALKNVSYTLEDTSVPAVTVAGGSLFTGAVQTGGQSISYAASDQGSGVYRVIAVVNGEDAAAAPGDCDLGDGFAHAFKPCAGSLTGSIALNTAAEPWHDGRNKVQLCVEDYSSDSRRCTENSNVLVLNGCAPNTTPAQTMSLGWPGKRGVIRSRQGRGRRATARLFGPARTPLAGASVCFSRGVPTDKSGKERVLEGAAVTGADGSTAVRVRGQTSRFVRATYFADPETVITKKIRLEVSPAIRFALRPKGEVEVGEKVRAVAMLRGKHKGSRRVCFFVSKSGKDKFACDKTGPGGRARAGFETREPGKLRFFAKVPNQQDYPYTRGKSATKRKQVNP